jgi:hypothetical protein
MSIRSLVIEAAAVPLLQLAGYPNEEWFESFAVSDPKMRVQSVTIDNVAMIFTDEASDKSRVLVVDLGRDNFFLSYSGPQRQEVLRRILIAAQSAFARSMHIPHSWRPFKSGSKVSFNDLPYVSAQLSSRSVGRVEIETCPDGNDDVFVFSCTSAWNDLSDAKVDRSLYRKLRSKFDEVSASKPVNAEIPGGAGAICLSDETFFHTENQLGFEEWINSKLTIQQRTFVEAETGKPIRLRGAAGTGKTLALAIRCLVAMRSAVQTKTPKRIVFLTHSASTAAATEALISSLDRSGIRSHFDCREGNSFSIMTLLDHAMLLIGDDLQSAGILPLATDALEGRRLQLELIESIISEYVKSGDWQVLKNTCSDEFRAMLGGANEKIALRKLGWELMNEFACVLDADGVQQKPDNRKRYLSSPRMAWMLPLQSQNDRIVVLELYDRFNRIVSEMDAISVDQLIADYLNYLDSFRWNAVRDRRGFDEIFVDELHLFNRQERMAFHGLLRSLGKSAGIYMAYDAKQSPSDSFMPSEERESASAFWGRLGFGGIEKVELDRIFRYTPEIARFITSLDESYPALELGEDWGRAKVETATQSARTPTITTLTDDKESYREVMARAHAIKRRGGQNYGVAVLCCNVDTFDVFRNAGEHRAWFRAVASRDEAAGARPDAFKFILSTPEYVAGLQFDCVLLIDVNQSEVPNVAYSAGLRRRFISKIYLGSSRAMKHLELYATKVGGGAATILDSAMANGALISSPLGKLASASDVVDS